MRKRNWDVLVTKNSGASDISFSFSKASHSRQELSLYKGRRGYRIRIGDYRVLYEVDEPNQIVNITAIGHRRDVYR